LYVLDSSQQELYHYTHYSLAALTPVALILSPSFLNIPVDLALGVALPLHFSMGLIQITEDYVPRPQQHLVKIIVYIVCSLSFIGLLKINLCGAGITESFKAIYRGPKTIKEEKN
jgi:succinate dehydrogenase (ubiquinone) membrane anchor subunit